MAPHPEQAINSVQTLVSMQFGAENCCLDTRNALSNWQYVKLYNKWIQGFSICQYVWWRRTYLIKSHYYYKKVFQSGILFRKHLLGTSFSILELRGLKISPQYKMNIFQCMDDFKVYIWNSTQTYLAQILTDAILIRFQNFKISHKFNSLAPGKFEWNFRYVILKWMDFSNSWLRNLLWNCPSMNVTGLNWWSVNIGSGNGLVPSGNKPLPEPMLTKISVAIWCH